MSSGIFQKTCPACATLLTLEQEQCECGYGFDADPEIANAAQEAVEEELFEAYLAARVDQALASLLEARNELAAMPGDFDKASLVMRRVNELNTLRGDIEAQKAKSAAARARVDAVRAGVEAPIASETPTDAFREAQAARAQLAAGVPGTRICPTCQSSVPADSARCSCGYRFESALSATRTGRPADGAITRD